MKNTIFGILVIVLLSITTYFISTELRYCEGEGLTHLQHQLDNLKLNSNIKHRYIK